MSQVLYYPKLKFNLPPIFFFFFFNVDDCIYLLFLFLGHAVQHANLVPQPETLSHTSSTRRLSLNHWPPGSPCLLYFYSWNQATLFPGTSAGSGLGNSVWKDHRLVTLGVKKGKEVVKGKDLRRAVKLLERKLPEDKWLQEKSPAERKHNMKHFTFNVFQTQAIYWMWGHIYAWKWILKDMERYIPKW